MCAVKKHKRRKNRRFRVSDPRRLAAFVALTLIFAVSTGLLVDYAVGSIRRRKNNDRQTQEFAEAFTGTDASTEPPAAPVSGHAMPETFRRLSGSILPKAQQLQKQNGDLAGWLYIQGVVDLPVVYRDNEFYLNHNFYGKEDSGGALFLDEFHPLKEDTQHLVIHGHNMHDSSMFGIVRSYSRLENVLAHPFARFSTIYAPEDYVICAVVRLDPDPDSSRYFSYIGKPRFLNTEDFYHYTDALKERSMFDIPIDIQPADSLLTLSTCIGDDRLIVTFRRLRSGEDRDQLQARVQLTKEKDG